MLPRLAPNNFIDRAFISAVALSKRHGRLSILNQFEDSSNIHFCKFVVMASLALWFITPSFTDRVELIFARGAKKEMGRIDAVWVVAPMTSLNFWSNTPIMQNPRQTRGVYNSSANSRSKMASFLPVFSSDPLPASIRISLNYLAPKSLGSCWREAHVRKNSLEMVARNLVHVQNIGSSLALSSVSEGRSNTPAI